MKKTITNYNNNCAWKDVGIPYLQLVGDQIFVATSPAVSKLFPSNL